MVTVVSAGLVDVRVGHAPAWAVLCSTSIYMLSQNARSLPDGVAVLRASIRSGHNGSKTTLSITMLVCYAC